MSGTAFNTLMDSYVTSPSPGPVPTADNGGATLGAGMGPSPAGAAAAADLQGTPPLFGGHNLPLHVAIIGLIAFAVIILLRKAGFRGMVAGRVSVGGR